MYLQSLMFIHTFADLGVGSNLFGIGCHCLSISATMTTSGFAGTLNAINIMVHYKSEIIEGKIFS